MSAISHSFLCPCLDVDVDAWCSVMRVNVDGLLLDAQAFLPGMMKVGVGRVVCMSSSVVGEPQAIEMTRKASSKAGGFALSLAGEAGRHGITVDCSALASCPLVRRAAIAGAVSRGFRAAGSGSNAGGC